MVRNSTTPNVNTLVKMETSGRGAEKTELVRLVAGDVLTVLIHASHQVSSTTTTVDNNPFAMSFSVE